MIAFLWLSKVSVTLKCVYSFTFIEHLPLSLILGRYWKLKDTLYKNLNIQNPHHQITQNRLSWTDSKDTEIVWRVTTVRSVNLKQQYEVRVDFCKNMSWVRIARGKRMTPYSIHVSVDFIQALAFYLNLWNFYFNLLKSFPSHIQIVFQRILISRTQWR